MTKNTKTYQEAIDFMAKVSDRYEVKIVKTKDGYMVVCER